MEAVSATNRDASYRFGDSDLAAERLRLLAEVFAPGMRAFLQPLRAEDPKCIADLGCGPGCTTRLIADVFPEANILGLDNSERFVDLASRQSTNPRVSFRVANVGEPLPGESYDLIYCRYLLTHLPDPFSALVLWSQSLSPRGLIAIEENDWIETAEPAFEKYVRIVEAILAAGNQRLYVGAELANMDYGPAVRVKSSELAPIGVSSGETARMFRMNLDAWRDQPQVRESYSTPEIGRLASDLDDLVRRNSAKIAITFGRRRLVLEKQVEGSQDPPAASELVSGDKHSWIEAANRTRLPKPGVRASE